MNPEFREEALPASRGEQKPAEQPPPPPGMRRNLLAEWANRLLQLGLGESLLRIGTTVSSLLLVAAAVWLMSAFDEQVPLATRLRPALASGPTATPFLDASLIPPAVDEAVPGVPRLALPFTNVPTRPRTEIVKYTVQTGDSVFGIAEKFGLKPQTILWGNYNVLVDDPHSLSPGQELNILPVDGVYYEWVGGVSFEEWAKFFGVTAQDILEYPGNHLETDKIGDPANPNIPPNTWLIIPGGSRELIVWSAPLGVTRENPASAQVMGPGACEPAYGVSGYGTFVWPANKHYLSGYDYQPPIHWGIDIAGNLGEGVYAADAGVVVYSGLNKYGYGNMIMIDHGTTGFQTLYAHLNEIYVGCGQSVGQGDPIGAIGSTGKSSGAHLHFEIRTTTYFVNPWDYLPPP